MAGPTTTDAPRDGGDGGRHTAGRERAAGGARRGRIARLGARIAAVARLRRGLAAEAGWELMRARIDTLRPLSHYGRHLGRRDGVPAPVVPRDEALAAEIGAAVEAVAAVAPFRAQCLQQALAVRRMLARRGVAVVVHIGMARDAGDLGAHAWVTAGRRVVAGDRDLERYVIIGTFS